MSILYYYAAVMNRLVLGTGNKSELRLGYFTKYGDAAVDLMPIGDLYKSEVRELAQLTDTVEDTLAFDELKELNVDADRIKGADLTHAQIFDLLDRLRRIQKNRTF